MFSSVLLFLTGESTTIFGDDVLVVVKNDFDVTLLGPLVTNPLVIPVHSMSNVITMMIEEKDNRCR